MNLMIQSSTRDVRLFAALSSMGIPWTHGTAAVENKDRVWQFGETSDCGKWKTKDLLKWWRDSDFPALNPDHPFQVVKSCMASGHGIKQYVKQGGGIIQRPSGGSFVMTRIEECNELGATSRASDESHFVASLSAVGFRVWACKSTGFRRIFGIGATSETRGYTFEQARAWWLDKAFIELNNQHPFAYAKAAALNYHGAISAMVKDRALVEWRPPGSIGKAYIHPDCGSETEQQISARLFPEK